MSLYYTVIVVIIILKMNGQITKENNNIQKRKDFFTGAIQIHNKFPYYSTTNLLFSCLEFFSVLC